MKCKYLPITVRREKQILIDMYCQACRKKRFTFPKHAKHPTVVYKFKNGRLYYRFLYFFWRISSLNFVGIPWNWEVKEVQ